MDQGVLWLYGLLGFGALIGMCEWVAIGALCGLGYQAFGWVQTGKWTTYTLATLASQFSVPVDYQPHHWVTIDRFVHYVLFDNEAAVVLLGAAIAVAPVRVWLKRRGFRGGL
jgi:hypothetical protein